MTKPVRRILSAWLPCRLILFYMGLIHALGIDVRILLAQFFNFAILVFILWRFAYKPIFKILEERRSKIEKGLNDAEASAERLRLAEEESKKIILQSRQEAAQVMEKAQKQAELRQAEIIKKAESDIAIIMDKEKAKIAAEKNATFIQLKQEVSSLVLLGLQRFLAESLNDTRDQEIIAKVIKSLD